MQVPGARAIVAEEQLARAATHGAGVRVAIGTEPSLDAFLGRRVEAQSVEALAACRAA